MSKLHPLKQKILSLKARRRNERLQVAFLSLLVFFVWALASIFVLDWIFESSIEVRLVLVALGFGAWIYSLIRYSLPWLKQNEPGIEVTLLVEREQKIDNDLVAAIQFEGSTSTRWGSGDLQEAVVDEAAKLSQSLNLRRGYSNAPKKKWFILALVSVAFWGGLAAFQVDHTIVFFKRLLLGSDHYPTETQIVRVGINGRWLAFAETGQAEIFLPYGQPLVLEAEVEGKEPAIREVTLKAEAQDIEKVIPLEQGDKPKNYSGTLARLSFPLNCRFDVGDAWTDPLKIKVIPLPVIESHFKVEPPDYISQENQEAIPPGARTFFVEEGSQVQLKVSEVNKRLDQVVLQIGESAFPLKRQSEDPLSTWQLPPDLKTPLNSLTQAISYRLEIVDQDGLKPEALFTGNLRIKTDRKPRVTQAVITRYVLSKAKPSISFGSVDDHGLSSIDVKLEVIRDGETVQERQESIRDETALKDHPKLVKGKHTLDLSQLDLKMGDRVKAVIHAKDFRGSQPGQESVSQAVILQVTDERGVLAAMVETDERSARQLDAIIDRQLGIGNSR